MNNMDDDLFYLACCLLSMIDWIDFIMLCVLVAVILSSIACIGNDLMFAIFSFIFCSGG